MINHFVDGIVQINHSYTGENNDKTYFLTYNMISSKPRQIPVPVIIGKCNRRQSSEVISIVNYMQSKLKFTHTNGIYYRVRALLICFFRIIMIFILVLVCYQSHIRIWIRSVNMSLTDSLCDLFKTFDVSRHSTCFF